LLRRDSATSSASNADDTALAESPSSRATAERRRQAPVDQGTRASREHQRLAGARARTPEELVGDAFGAVDQGHGVHHVGEQQQVLRAALPAAGLRRRIDRAEVLNRNQLWARILHQPVFVFAQLGKLYAVNVPCQAKLFERPDSVPVDVNLIPLEAVPR